MKFVRYFLAAVALLFVTAPATAAEKAPVAIGLQGPITGAWAYEGQMAKQACEIAVELVNKKGGIMGGRRIVLKVVDDAGEPKTGALAAQKLVSQKDVVAAISTYGSSVCEPAAGIYERFRKVNIGYGVTAVRLTGRGFKYFFRTCGRDDSQGKFFAERVLDTFKAKRIAIMHDNTAFGRGLAVDTKKALASLAKGKKVEIVYFDAITPGEKDYRVSLTNLREAKPDIWYYTGYYAEAAILVGQARDIGIRCPFVGGNAAINDEFVKIAGLKLAKGCFMTNEPLPAGLPYKEAKEFLKAYRDRFGDIPSSPWPIYAADALNIIAYALDKTGSTDADTLADYLRNKVDKVRGITGPIGFTAQGDREGVPFYLYVVSDTGKIVISR